MSTIQMVVAVIGGLIIVVVVYNIIRNGIARSNGKIPDLDPMWMGGDIPPP